MSNPCLQCTIQQGCCTNLSGLLLSRREYEAHFARHEENLITTHKGSFFQVTSKKGVCPNWDGQCTLYGDRPAECRLFPVTVGAVEETSTTLTMTLHSRTTCPQKETLLPSDEEAIAMARALASDAVGDTKTIRVFFERGLMRAGAFGLKVIRKAGFLT